MVKQQRARSKQKRERARESKRVEIESFREKLLQGSIEEVSREKRFQEIANSLRAGDHHTLHLLFAGSEEWTEESWERVFRYLEGLKKMWKEELEALALSADLALETRLRLLEYLAQREELSEPAKVDVYRSAKALRDKVVTSLESSTPEESLATLIPEFHSLSPSLILDVIRSVAARVPEKTLPLYEALLGLHNEAVLALIAEMLKQSQTEKAAQLLQAILQQTENKEIQKAAKRSLYHLKSAGIDVEIPKSAPDVQPALSKPQFHIQSALVSPIDGAGYRAIWLARTKPFGGYNVVYLLVCDREGIKECMGAPISKRELPELIGEMQREDFPFIEIEPAYCQQLVAESYQKNLSTGTEVPREYFRLREIIGEPEQHFAQPLIYQELHAQEVAEQPYHLANSAQLFTAKEFQSWYIPHELAQKYLSRFQEMEASPIVVSPMAQKEREEEVLKAALEEFFDPEMTTLYQRRLEEMAYLLLRTGKEAEARMALAVALALQGKEGKELFSIPFMRKMVERSFFETKEEESPLERDPGNLIVPAWR